MTTTTMTRTESPATTARTQSVEARLALVRDAFAYLMVEPAKRNPADRERIFSPEFHIFGPARENCGNLPAVRPGHDLFTGFSDAELDLDDMVTSGDRVITYIRFRGTHTGEFEGHKPTGRRMSADGMVVHRFGADGRIAEQWSVLRWR
jgi:hypothetical protein